MGITRSTIVDAPVEEVFAWFSRPGAFTRLASPLAPMGLVREADSLADGAAVLKLPGGLRWVAQHDREAYVEERRFVDAVTPRGPRSLPTGVLPWRHTHEFEPADDDRTKVIDSIDTVVPERFLATMVEFRHRQLAGDLAAHQRAAVAGMAPLTIAVSGASGMVGQQVAAFLSTGGHRVIRLVRHPAQDATERQWNPEQPAADLFDDVDAVVHLAGAPIAGRFTESHKRAIAESRIEPTRRLSQVAADAGVSVFVSASAVGFYGRDRGDEVLTEKSSAPAGDDFLADVCARWEGAANAGAGAMRVVTVRTGIVQSPAGGVLKMLLPPFWLGVGGRLGDGEQWQPWIAIDDLVDIYHRALWDDALSGPVNAASPGIVRNTDYSKQLAKALGRWAVIPTPSFAPKLVLGQEGAQNLAFASQRVVPEVLTARGHEFRTPVLSDAFAHLLGN